MNEDEQSHIAEMQERRLAEQEEELQQAAERREIWMEMWEYHNQ